MNKKYKVGILGATGVVGQEILDLLHQLNFPYSQITLLASQRSAGKEVTYGNKTYTVKLADENCFDDLDVCIFSAGASSSKEFAPIAASKGCVVIDNSSAFRMDENVPLVVPEVNPHHLKDHKGIIANPNCTTAISLMALYPLHQKFGLKKFFASTYQAVSGSGWQAMEELINQTKDWSNEKDLTIEKYPHQILFNVLPHIDVFLENGYTKEEMKMLNESKKIMSHGTLKCTTTCVRVPVLRAHSVAISAEFEKEVSVEEARNAISQFSGAVLEDDINNLKYPMPLNYQKQQKCGVGRIRKDTLFDNGLSMWVSGDQLWKGAALNAVQIALEMAKQDLLGQK